MFKSLTGVKKSSVFDKAAWDTALEQAHKAVTRIEAEATNEEIPLFTIADETHALEEIEAIADGILNIYAHVVIVGMGGSTLSGQAFAPARSKYKELRLHYLDTVNADKIRRTLRKLPLKHTLFLIISKSGGTLETISTLSYIWECYTQAGLPHHKHISVITERREDNRLFNAAKAHHLRILPHHKGIGGRFAAFTNVGLLPAALAGKDIRALAKGAGQAVADIHSELFVEQIAMHLMLMQSGYRNMVLMPYMDGLDGYIQLYRQIWAESLGKDGHGSLPVDSKGVLDQHSQLQYYLDGPPLHYFTVYLPQDYDSEDVLGHAPFSGEDFPYLANVPLSTIEFVSGRATYETLLEKQLPVRRIELPPISEEMLGYLVMSAMLETIAVGYALDINPYDQPAVEIGKNKARSYLRALGSQQAD